MQKAWAEGKRVGILLMDVKGTFIHVSRNWLLYTMEGIQAVHDLTQ